METNKTETKRIRKIKLSDNPELNVKVVATARFNRALRAIKALGNCTGRMYHYTPEQLKVIEDTLADYTASCIDRLTKGKTVAVDDVKL